MHVVASFEYSTELELAIQKLHEAGVNEENIIAIPLDKSVDKPQLFDTIHHSDGKSILDVGLIFGCIFMLLGSIYGFILQWGPVIWGLIGLIFGLTIGILLKLLIIKNEGKMTNKKCTEVFLAVRCKESQLETIKSILFKHYALGIGCTI